MTGLLDQLRAWLDSDEKTIDQELVLLVEKWKARGMSEAELAGRLLAMASQLGSSPTIKPSQGA
jgi:hypothetical protein